MYRYEEDIRDSVSQGLHIHAYIHTCVDVQNYATAYVYAVRQGRQVCMCVTRVLIYMLLCMCIYARIYACTNTHMCVYTRTQIYSQLHICVHIYSNTRIAGLPVLCTHNDTLSYTHLGEGRMFDNRWVDFRAEVGLLSRNIVVQVPFGCLSLYVCTVLDNLYVCMHVHVICMHVYTWWVVLRAEEGMALLGIFCRSRMFFGCESMCAM